MAFGDFARLDGYDPDAGFKDTFANRFGAAPLSAEEAAALRQRQFTNRPPTTSPETIDKLAGVASDVFIPKTPLDAASMIALGPVGRVPARIGALALGGLLQSDEAQAGPVSKALGLLKGKVGGPWEGGIRAYHSSPHDFEKVDFSKLRTGEGANSYGAGHYMAENPKVSGQGGQYWGQFLHRFPTQEIDAANLLALSKFDRELAAKEAREMLNRNREWEALTRSTAEREDVARRNAHFEETVKVLEGDKPVGPRTYEMNLRAKPEELLDWDKPLASQPKIASALEQLPVDMFSRWRESGAWPHVKGETAYREMSGGLTNRAHAEGKDVGASQMLRDAGIPGIRYLDEGSRWKVNPINENILRRNLDMAQQEFAMAQKHGDPAYIARQQDKLAKAEAAMNPPPPTYNYVGTDPSKLDILAKYGIVGGALPFGALAAQDKYQQ